MTIKLQVYLKAKNITRFWPNVLVTYLLFALVFWCSPSKAEDEYVEAQTNETLDLFFSLCVTDNYRAQLMFDLAEKNLWLRLPNKAVESRRAPDIQRFEGWVGNLPELTKSIFLVYAGEAVEINNTGKVNIETCGMFFGDVKVDEFIDIMTEQMEGKVIEETKSGKNQTIVFQSPKFEQLLVTLIVDENTVEGRGIFAMTVLVLNDPS
jgi:hypothetical protein